jgi:hypothetical protein
LIVMMNRWPSRSVVLKFPIGATVPTGVGPRRTERPPSRQMALEEVTTQPATPPTVAEVTGAPLTDDPDATVAIPWLPSLDDGDDLGGVLAAESPLLARAFRGTDRPR